MPQIIFSFAVFALLTATAWGSDLFVEKIGENQYRLTVRGEIAEGDSERIMRYAAESPVEFVRASIISLDSPGGSVSEAIEIADIIERSAMLTTVAKDAKCASACLLLYVAGQIRIPGGPIYVHRPYLGPDAANKLSIDEARIRQKGAMTAVKLFLEERFVPRTIIDSMMTISSEKAHLLTHEELEEIGFSTAAFEETSIAKCGASPNGFVDGDILPQQQNCIKTLMTIARLQFIEKIFGIERARSVWEEIRKTSATAGS